MEISWPALIIAVAMVETGYDPEAINPISGACTHLQITGQMIKEYNLLGNRKPVTREELMLNPALAEKMFVELVEEYVDPLTPIGAAFFWRCGRGYKSKDKSKAVKAYAERVNNLYELYKQELGKED